MKIAGIIAEYDPFHWGHEAHIAATHQNGGATHIVAVISGSFTQRGEPALVGKFRRAEMALRCGADLVLELPLPWAMASAEVFADGGVAVLKGLGCVDMLSFGSECGDVATLQELAVITEKEDFQAAVRLALEQGLSYPAAMQTAANRIIDDKADAFTGANNTLALEYIRATIRQQADFQYFTLQRQGAGHHDIPTGGYASAGWLRGNIRQGNITETKAYIPAASYGVLADAFTAGQLTIRRDNLDMAVLAKLRTMTVADFAALPYVSEGLEHRLWQAAQGATAMEVWLQTVKTRRYTYARLQRLGYAALLGLDGRYKGTLPPYIRILGLNERGKEILAVAKPSLPFITRAGQLEELIAPCRELFDLECRATDLHALAMPHPLPCGTDKTTRLITL